MYSVYDRWPEIAKTAFQSDLEECKFSDINHIVFAGMGGSGAIGSVFSSILSKSKIHVSVVKGYLLPKTVDKDTLVVTTSISGNTIETLTALNSSTKLECKIISCSSGGKMEDFCKKNNVEYRKIPLIHSPRASFTGFLYSMLKILNPVIPINQEEVYESIKELEKMKKKISSNNLNFDNPAIDLAKWISGIPLIYYPAGLQAAAVRFKNSLQENSKIHAITEDVVESCHNGIVAWEQPSKIMPILIQGNDDYIKTKERWEIVKEYFKTKNIEYKEILSGNGSILTKLLRLIYLLDYCSIYRAVLSKMDPTPIPSINFVKNRL
ncbi:MAG: SIS domain-containing protein [Nitrosopumilus sp.]|nr:SIS domain-containing protein [Nitrosopumilus sp.]NNL59616.1 SIS domain-containing protein [Nitrosopumilus sp.]